MLFVALAAVCFGLTLAQVNMINMGLAEVIAESTAKQGTTTILAPGYMAFKIVPPGTLSMTVTATGVDWGAVQPQFDVYLYTDDQWQKTVNNHIGGIGSFSVFKQKVSSFTINQALTQSGTFWVILDNANSGGTAAAEPPVFSKLTFTWNVKFDGQGSAPAGTVGKPRCPPETPGTPSNVVGAGALGICASTCTYNCGSATCTLSNSGNADSIRCQGGAPTVGACANQQVCNNANFFTCPATTLSVCSCYSTGDVAQKLCVSPAGLSPNVLYAPCLESTQSQCNALAASRGGCPAGTGPLCVCAATALSTPILPQCYRMDPTPMPVPGPVLTPMPVPAVTPMPVPGQVVTPMPVPGQVVTPMPVPGQVVTPMPVPGQVVTPMPVPGQVVTPMPVPGQVVQTTPMPVPGVFVPFNPTPMPVPGAGPAPTPVAPMGQINCPASQATACAASPLAVCATGQTPVCFCTLDGFTIKQKFCNGAAAVPQPQPEGPCPPDLQAKCEEHSVCTTPVCTCSNGSLVSASCSDAATTVLGIATLAVASACVF